MTDAPFVLAAYAIVLGSLIGYGVVLARRTAAAVLAEWAVRRELDER